MRRVQIRLNFVAIGDINGDGKLDIVTRNRGSRAVSVLLGNGNGTFQPETTSRPGDPRSVAIGDVNGDGKPDLVVANQPRTASRCCSAMAMAPSSAITYATGSSPLSLAIGDVNGTAARPRRS